MRFFPYCFLTTLFIFCACQPNYAQKGKYTDFDRGYALYYAGIKPDSAFYFFNRYVNNPDDSLKKGRAYLAMGNILWTTGDLYGAQESLLNCVRSLNPEDTMHREYIAYAYSTLGNVSLDMKRYDESIMFYNQCIPLLKGNPFLAEVLNGKATTFQKMNNYPAAIATYDSILLMKPADQSLVARVIDNRARTKWLQDPSYPSLPELWAAMKIRTDSQYTRGLNASYAHLSEYYENSNRDSALWYADKMLAAATELQSRDDMLEAMDKLIRLHSNADTKQQWYVRYKKMDDSLQLARDTTRNRFALIRYDVQKSRTDNLILQQQNTKQRTLMYALIAAAIIIIVSITLWYRKRRQRMKQEAENALRNQRLKTSQKIHDVVANGLYGIMNELEHSKTVDREPIINKIEGLYEKSRNISYEDIHASDHQGYDRQIHELLTAFANDHTKVIVVGNQDAFWNKVSTHQKQELQLVLNELMVNMKKHSHAKNVSVVFKEENHKGFIIYKDDGVGFPEGRPHGQGLTSTVNRIYSLNGSIIFGKSGQEGSLIEISFPL